MKKKLIIIIFIFTVILIGIAGIFAYLIYGKYSSESEQTEMVKKYVEMKLDTDCKSIERITYFDHSDEDIGITGGLILYDYYFETVDGKIFDVKYASYENDLSSETLDKLSIEEIKDDEETEDIQEESESKIYQAGEQAVNGLIDEADNAIP